MGSGGGQSTTTSGEQVPWKHLQQPLRTGYAHAEESILNRPTEFYPGRTTTDFSPHTSEALGRQYARGQAGSPLLRASQDYTQGLLTDPQSSPIFDAVMSETRPGIDSAFAGAGRSGSGLHAEALGRGVTRGLAPYTEAAADRAPGLAREDYYDIDRMGGVGRAIEQQQQRVIDEGRERFEYGQNEPTRRVMQYMNALSPTAGLGGGTTSTTSGDGKGAGNSLLTAAGLGLGAAGTAGGLGWQPFARAPSPVPVP